MHISLIDTIHAQSTEMITVKLNLEAQLSCLDSCNVASRTGADHDDICFFWINRKKHALKSLWKNNQVSSLRFNSHFPGGPGLADTRMSPFWILLEIRTTEVVVTTGTIRCAKLQSNCHHQQTNSQLFYRSYSPPDTQITVSGHWKEKNN